MIKENKDKQREKNGSNSTIKTELPGTQVSTSETTVKEEPSTESHLNGSEDGEGSCKKNGMRVSGNSTPSSTSTCGLADLKPNLIGSSNTGTVTVGTNRPSSSTQGSGDLCLVDSAQEAKSEDSNTQDKPPSCSAVKSEINGNSNHEFTSSTAGTASTTGDPCETVLPMGMALSTSSGPPPNGVQPLPSNVINKQPGTMEAQYMQQQSQIFVFSTTLANKSAEAVLQGQFPSIIAYHCAQPGTKKYLEKHPLKMNQFNRQNPAQWLNSLAQMKQKGGPGVMKGLPGGFQSPNMMGEMGTSPNSGGGMGIWNQNVNNNSNNTNNNIMSNMNPGASGGNHLMQPCSSNILPGCPVSTSMKTPGMDSPCLLSASPNTNPMLPGGIGHHSPSMPSSNTPMLPGPPDMAGSPGMNHGNLAQPSLTGVKVPDENLTPQQRQHREEQLATLRKMQQMLFPEHQSPLPEGANLSQPSDGMVMHSLGPIMSLAAGPGQGGGMMSQKNLIMGGIGGPSQMTPASAAAQMEWQKLQQQFFEERKKKPSGLVVGSSGSGLGSPVGSVSQQSSGPVSGLRGVSGPGSVGQVTRTQGPPPPYHQTTRSASVPTAMPSPNPSSPNNPTSNLSLPSPRAASGLNSPSEPNRPQFGLGGGSNSSSRLIGPGPSPTGLDSPTASRPLNPSNPSTPVSTHLSPSAVRKEPSEFTVITQGTSSQPISTTISNQQPPVDGMFCRTLQSLAQQKQQQLPNPTSKEPNLMPVPSPQQIQYLNTFEGQELTIQKQPNTSLKDTNIRSPSLPPPNLESSIQPAGSDLTSSRMSGPGTPLTPTSIEMGSRYPPASGELNRFPIPSPLTPGSEIKSQQPRFPGPSPQSQGSRTPGMEPPIKTPTTEVGSRFLSTSPQMGDGMGPPRFSNSAGTSPAMGSQTQNFMQQTTPSIGNIKVASHFLDVSPSSSASAAVDVSPTGPSNFPCLRSENVPLNPNGNGGVPCNGKMTHFDPITSMAQMSQQLTSSVANSPGTQNPGMINSVPGGPCPSGMLPFNSPGMHPMQLSDMGGCQGLSDSQPSGGGLVNPMAGGPGGQPGPGNFVSIQLQNVPPHSYSPNSSVGGVMVPCSGTVSTTACMNQPIAHPNSSGSPKPGNIMMGLGPPRGSSPYASSPVPQRIMGRPSGPSPYNGANVQVKASAPNTIQYLPAKPQAGNSGPRGPPSLDFLQRFANPLSNLESKVPTHNLQYFPNSGQSNAVNMGGLNVPMNRPNGLIGSMNPQMSGLSGPNCGGVGGPMGNLNGPIMGPNGPLVGMNLPMSGGMVMGPGGPSINMVPLRGGLRPGGMMRMQQIGGGMFGVPSSPGQSVGSEQMFGGGPNQSIPGGGPNSQVFVPGSKSSPMGLGSAPDASQPLPPSMGQSNNFKNSPFIGPTTADPNYAQQFHNFQQQLYATNTRSQMNNQAIGPNQSFFVPK